VTTVRASRPEPWPSLDLDAWKDTCATLHLWTQIVGKVRLAQSPWVNHSWHVTLYVTARGLTTSPIPYGTRTFQIDFDFISHRLTIESSGVPNLTDRVTREAYSHEVSSCGFWPGGVAIPYPAFYSYAYPEPDGFSKVLVKPNAGFYSTDLHEFILAYDVVRQSESPDQVLLDFLQTTYEAAANLAGWDRDSLERPSTQESV
jgi:Family of unknown function (DUF5996)